MFDPGQVIYMFGVQVSLLLVEKIKPTMNIFVAFKNNAWAGPGMQQVLPLAEIFHSENLS